MRFKKNEEETKSLPRVSTAGSNCWTLGAMHSRDIKVDSNCWTLGVVHSRDVKVVPGECIEMLVSVDNQTC